MKNKVKSNTFKNNNQNSILITKSKKSNLKSISKIQHFKILKKSSYSHLKHPKKKSSNSLKTSKKTEKNITNKKEIKILINILEWLPKVWLKFNKSECHFNNKSWWKSVFNNITLPNININLVHSCKSKWWTKASDHQAANNSQSNKLKEPLTSKYNTWKLMENKWLKN